jgi:hypothetical protein
MTDQKTYSEDELNALSADDVEKLASDLGVEPETGSGVTGNVLKPDRVAAILAAQRTEGDDGDTGTVQQGDGREKTAIEAAPDGTETALTVDAAAGEHVEIRRTSERAWWCPICDYSHPHGVTLCTGCGAERNGDEVIAHGDQ